MPTYDGAVLDDLTRPYALAVGGDVTRATWDGMALTIAFTPHPGVPFTQARLVYTVRKDVGMDERRWRARRASTPVRCGR